MNVEIDWDKKRRELAEASANAAVAHQRELEAKAIQEQIEAEAKRAFVEKRRLVEERFEVFTQNAPKILKRVNKELFNSQGKVQGWYKMKRDWVDEGWSGGWKNGSPYTHHYTDHELVLAFSLQSAIKKITKNLEIVCLLQRDRRNIFDKTISPGDKLLPQKVGLRTNLSVKSHTSGEYLNSQLDLIKSNTEDEMLEEFVDMIITTTSRMYVDEN